jgi:hypothetical protein
MSEPTYTDENRRGTLQILRVVWLALIVGQVGFGAVVLYQASTGQSGDQSQLTGQMLGIAIGVLIGAVGLGYFARNQSYKKHWHGDAVAPPGFFQGNLILLAMLEGSSFTTLVFVMVTGQVFPMVLPAVASLAIQCANFPSGLPMQPAPPDFSQGPR